MLSLRDDAAFSAALEKPIGGRLKRLLRKRRMQLGGRPLTDVAHFVVIEAGEEIAAINCALGIQVLENHADGSNFGDPDFSPNSEWIADHGFCFEVVFIFEDSGFAHVLIVPKRPDVDAELIRLCEQFALPEF